MTSQHKPIFLFSLALLSICTMVSSDTILTLLAEHSSIYNTISIKFNETMFALFYTCLCEQERHECSIKYNPVNKPFKPLALQPANLKSNQQSFSNYYQCNHNPTWLEVKCLRLRVEDMTCKQTSSFTIIPRPSNISCDFSCVGLVWFNPGRESLIYNSTKQIQTFCPDCSEPPSTKTAPTPIASLLPTPPLSIGSTSISRESMDDSKKDNGTDDNHFIPILMGVVIGVLFIILLAIAIIFLVRRRKKRNLRGPGQSSFTPTNGKRDIHEKDDYETVGTEPTTSNNVSISENTRTIPDFDLTTVPPADDINNTETVSTYVNHPHNGDVKREEVLDNFGYSTIDTEEEIAAETGKAHPSYENFAKIRTDQPSREMANATDNGLPGNTVVNIGHQNKQYYNFLTQEDRNHGIPPASFSPDSDLSKPTIGNETDRPSTEYVNSFIKTK